MPVVSVVMPAFNAADTIVSALLSVQAQTLTDWELWVVDDASGDLTAQCVCDLASQDPRINLVRLPANSGSPAVPRNTGLARARGTYVAFLDADDTWAPDKLELQLAAMRRANAAVSCTGATLLAADGHALDVRTPPAWATYQSLLKQNTLVCSSVMLQRNALAERQFPPMGHEDYALWLELARDGYEVLGLAEPLTIYHVRPNSLSANKLKVLPFFWRIYREREGYSRIRALFLTLRYAWFARQRAINHHRA